MKKRSSKPRSPAQHSRAHAAPQPTSLHQRLLSIIDHFPSVTITVLADLVAKGLKATEIELVIARESLLEEAKKQIVNDLATGRQKLEPGI